MAAVAKQPVASKILGISIETRSNLNGNKVTL
jgi:hypothetical protein